MSQEQGGPSTGGQVLNAAKFIADTAVMPGASQLVEGDVGTGIVYGVAGALVTWLTHSFLGPLGWIAVGMDSYSMSSSQKHIWQHFFGSAPFGPSAAVPANPVPETTTKYS
jgi:hypothetical protein